jgi:hypothetical protein
MDRFAIMPSIIERIPSRVIGIAALMCLDAGLIAGGSMVISETAPIDNEVAERPWIAPSPDPPIPSTGKTPAASSDDPALMRPIFFASRKPFEPPPQTAKAAAPAARPPPSDPALVVGGIVLTAKTRRAYLRRPAEADGRWHEAGQVIDGWSLAEIDHTGIVLEQAGRRFPIQLYPADLRAFKLERPSSRSGSLR